MFTLMCSLRLNYLLTVLSAAPGVGGGEDGPDVGGEVGGGGGPRQPELAVAGRPPEAYGVVLEKHASVRVAFLLVGNL